MKDTGLTATDITDWLTPRQALVILATAVESNEIAARALLERLRGGMVTAVAFNSVVTSENGKSTATFRPIDVEHWTRIYSSDEFWITGDLSYEALEYGNRRISVFRHFDVRFIPQDVQAMVDVLSKSVPSSADSTAKGEPAEPAQKEPRLPDAHLAAWFEFYKKIGGEIREEPAMRHVRMCFPCHSVTRRRIRDLIGPRPLGRPKVGGR